MARTVERLTDRQVRQLSVPGRYSDGDGLYLQVTQASDGETLRRSWLVRFRVAKSVDGDRLQKVTREMGLGTFPRTSLAQARVGAAEARAMAQRGDDPILQKSATIRARLLAEQEAVAAEARAMTFAQCAEAYVAAHKANWRNEKHISQWSATLKTYAYPVFGDVTVGGIDVAMVTKVLDPIWTTKAETARRLRGRIEAVLDWATVRGHRQGDNPARWRGHLDKALPQRSKRSMVRHHAALAFGEMAGFVTALKEQSGAAALALQFTILTAARTGETIGARWSEINLDEAVWTVPAARMKGGREHRVPLSSQALMLLRSLQDKRGTSNADGWVFSPDSQNPLSNMGMLMMLRRMKREDLTVHGFRSSFRDWAAERTSFGGEVAEAALAHAISNKVEAAYRRGDLFNKRRRLMQAWADFCCTTTPAKIVYLHATN